MAPVPVGFMGDRPIKTGVRSNGDFLLYAVGLDGSKDGGSLMLSTGRQGPGLWYRQAVVWPEPAPAEEVHLGKQCWTLCRLRRVKRLILWVARPSWLED